MTSRIRVLDEQTINRIAAGEVIENPASVVKELVENAVDAGATEICIEIMGGGRQLIRITDNGYGMNSDDALLSLERHATSKIKEVEDIHDISTMGFRGEAIPSIASISKFMILTCQQGCETTSGTMVIVDGGKIIQCCPAARSPGTTIEVKSLFFNIPVRKKFQKSPAHDQNEIVKMITTISLGHPQIKFQLISNHKTILSANEEAGSFLECLGERISNVLGRDFLESCCIIQNKKNEFNLRGYIGLPAHTRHNRTGQYLFINNRAITSQLITFAIREGYGTTLSNGRHPVFVLHLDLPGQLVDVNVHPQKKEVRLRQEVFLKEFIIHAIASSLQNTGSNIIEESDGDYEPLPVFSFSHIPFANDEIVVSQKPVFQRYFPKSHYFSENSNSSVQQIAETPFLFEAEPIPIPIGIIGTFANYILVDSYTLEKGVRKGLCLVDQRAAHRRIIYDKLSKNKETGSQMLLIPYTLHANSIEAMEIKANLEALQEMGIKIHEAGPATFLIDGLPSYLKDSNIKELVLEVSKELSQFKGSAKLENERCQKIALAASRAAVNEDKKLSSEEAKSLLTQLMCCENINYCPLGKPTILHLSPADIEKLFLRYS